MIPAYVLAALAAAVALVLWRRLAFPLAAGGILAGLALQTALASAGQPRPLFNSQVALFLLVPLAVFEGGLTFTPAQLRRDGIPVALLAGPGTLAFALGVAWLMSLSGLGWGPALALALAVAATDPMAALSLLRSSSAPRRLVALLEAESVFNDAVALTLFAVLAGGATWMAGAGLFARYSVLGAVGGGAAGAALGLLTRRTPRLRLPASLLLALGLSPLAAAAGASSLFAVIAGSMSFHRACGDPGPGFRRFWAALAGAAAVMAFVLTGSSIEMSSLGASLPGALLLLLAVTAARLVMVAAATALPRGPAAIPVRWIPALTWGGLRGGLSVGLALLLSEHGEPRLGAVALDFIALQLVLQAPSVGLVARLSGAVEEPFAGAALLLDYPASIEDDGNPG